MDSLINKSENSVTSNKKGFTGTTLNNQNTKITTLNNQNTKIMKINKFENPTLFMTEDIKHIYPNKTGDIIELYNELKKDKNIEEYLTPLMSLLEELYETDKKFEEIYKEITESNLGDNKFDNVFKQLNHDMYKLELKIIFDRSKEVIKQIEKKCENVGNCDNITEKYKKKLTDITEYFKQKINTMDKIMEYNKTNVIRETKDITEEVIKVLPKKQSNSNIKPINIISKDTSGREKDVSDYLLQNTPSLVNLLQTGGDGKFINNIHNLIDMYSILNTSHFLKFNTLLIDDNFDTIIKNLDIEKNTLKHYFIELNNDSKTIIFSVLSGLNNINIETIIKRDTKVYNQTFNTKSNNIFFKLTLLNLLKKVYTDAPQKINMFFNDTNKAEVITKIMVEYIVSLENIFGIYKKLVNLEDNLQEFYDKFINNNKKLYAYVKERIDNYKAIILNNGKITTEDRGKIINPRFRRRIVDDNTYFMNYYNTEGDNSFVEKNKKKITSEQTIINSDNDYTRDTKEFYMKKEFYMIGQFEKIFKANIVNSQVAEQLTELADKITGYTNSDGGKFNFDHRNVKDICIIGYGQSGSGKTSALLYFFDKSTQSGQDGILVELCKNAKIREKYNKLSLTVVEIFVKYDSDMVEPINMQYDSYGVRDLKPNGVEGTLDFIFDDNKKWWASGKWNLGQYMDESLKIRMADPTTNNPNSSRSHALIHIKFYSKENPNNVANMIICDLAGVENKFADNSGEDNKTIFSYGKTDKKIFGEVGKFIDLNKYTCNGISRNDKSKEKFNIEYNKTVHELNTIVDVIGQNNISGGGPNTKKTQKTTDIKSTLQVQKTTDIKSTPQVQKNIQSNGCVDDPKKMPNWCTIPLVQNWLETDPNVNMSTEQMLQELALLKDIKNIKTTKIILYPIDQIFKDFDTTKQQKIQEYLEKNGMIKTDRGEKKYIPSPENIKKLDDLIKKISTNIKNVTCYDYMVKTLRYNRKLRDNEGSMINRSLADARDNIRNFIMAGMAKEKVPLVYFNPDIDYCTDRNIDISYYEDFYKENINASTGKIFDVIQNKFGIKNTSNLVFVVFAVVNLSYVANNPPNPPYINLDKLYISTNVSETLKDYGKLLKKYKYYVSNFSEGNSVLAQLMKGDISTSMRNDVISMIDKLNASTLLGSLESTLILSKLFGSPRLCTFNEKHTELDKKYLNKLKKLTIYDKSYSGLELFNLLSSQEDLKEDEFTK
jgi:hypothetical protein